MDGYTHEEIVEVSERLYQALCVAQLIEGQGEDNDLFKHMHTDDLGKLLIRLIERPLTVLCELRSETQGESR